MTSSMFSELQPRERKSYQNRRAQTSRCNPDKFPLLSLVGLARIAAELSSPKAIVCKCANFIGISTTSMYMLFSARNIHRFLLYILCIYICINMYIFMYIHIYTQYNYIYIYCVYYFYYHLMSSPASAVYVILPQYI